MHFVFYCIDRPDHGAVRAANRAAHLAFLEGYKEQLVVGGPLLGDDGSTMVGSLLILDLPDHAAALAFRDQDPYSRADLFESVAIRPWRKVFPAA